MSDRCRPAARGAEACSPDRQVCFRAVRSSYPPFGSHRLKLKLFHNPGKRVRPAIDPRMRGRCGGNVPGKPRFRHHVQARSEEHTSELQSLMRISYAVFCLKKKKDKNTKTKQNHSSHTISTPSQTQSQHH